MSNLSDRYGQLGHRLILGPEETGGNDYVEAKQTQVEEFHFQSLLVALDRKNE